MAGDGMNEEENHAKDADPTRTSSPDAEPDAAPEEDSKAARRRKRARLTLRIPDDDVKREPAKSDTNEAKQEELAAKADEEVVAAKADEEAKHDEPPHDEPKHDEPPHDEPKHDEPPQDDVEAPTNDAPIAASPIIPLGEITGPVIEHLRASSRPPPAAEAPTTDDEKTPLMPAVIAKATGSAAGIVVAFDEQQPTSGYEIPL
jgi:hypothetical protein